MTLSLATQDALLEGRADTWQRLTCGNSTIVKQKELQL